MIPGPWSAHTFSHVFSQTLLYVLLWKDFAVIIKAPDQSTLRQGDYLGGSDSLNLGLEVRDRKSEMGSTGRVC